MQQLPGIIYPVIFYYKSYSSYSAYVSCWITIDQYKISITYQTPESLTLGREYSPEAFVLTNKWNLPEVDLDEKKSAPPKN